MCWSDVGTHGKNDALRLLWVCAEFRFAVVTVPHCHGRPIQEMPNTDCKQLLFRVSQMIGIRGRCHTYRPHKVLLEILSLTHKQWPKKERKEQKKKWDSCEVQFGHFALKAKMAQSNPEPPTPLSFFLFAFIHLLCCSCCQPPLEALPSITEMPKLLQVVTVANVSQKLATFCYFHPSTLLAPYSHLHFLAHILVDSYLTSMADLILQLLCHCSNSTWIFPITHKQQ
jgi:hypothetical protein